MNNIGAFFDIDGTLYREGLITEVFKKLIRYEIIDPMKWHTDVKPKYTRWDTRTGDYDDYLLGMVEVFKEALKGLGKGEMEFIARQVVNQKGDRVYRYTRDRLADHRRKGHRVIVISGSPVEIVSEMAKKYEIDDYVGSTYVMNDDHRYTGEVMPMWDSADKERAMRDFTEKYSIDLRDSFAYGDTSGDFSMFTLVGHPVCVNPTKELLNKIMGDEVKDRMRIIVERKDVIYSIDPRNLEFQ